MKIFGHLVYRADFSFFHSFFLAILYIYTSNRCRGIKIDLNRVEEGLKMGWRVLLLLRILKTNAE